MHVCAQAVCEIFNLGGARLSQSEKPETQKKLDKAIKELTRLVDEKSVASRVRFLIKVGARGMHARMHMHAACWAAVAQALLHVFL